MGLALRGACKDEKAGRWVETSPLTMRCKSQCSVPVFICYRIASMKLVSSCWIKTRIKDISFLVFSKMIRGSSDWQRRQLGAMTMARLLTSIFVMATLAGCTNTWKGSGQLKNGQSHDKARLINESGETQERDGTTE